MQPINSAVPGQPLRASDLNSQTSELKRQGNMSFDGGSISQEVGGIHFNSDLSKSFFASITGRDGYNYFFKEVQKVIPARGWFLNDEVENYKPLRKSLGTGDYAVEINGNITIPNGTVVLMDLLGSYGDDEDLAHNIYGFNFCSYGGDSVEQNVLVDIQPSPSGLTKVVHSWASYGADFTFSPKLMSCTDVIPKSLAGMKNRVLTVNASETGFEFGASVSGASGVGAITSELKTINATLVSLTSQISSLSNRLSIAENKIGQLEV